MKGAHMTQRSAYSYIRFSTPEQLKGDSLRRQLELSQRYADEHGLVINTSLSLRDLGLSAFDRSNIKRGALGVFLDAVRKGRVTPRSVLLVESLDRLSRSDVTDALSIFIELINAEITIVTLADGMEYSKEAAQRNWTQLIMSLTIMARAHEESATKSKRLSAVWAEKKRNALQRIVTSQVPAWLTVTNGKIVIDENKANIIRDIFSLIRNGYGLNLLERKLNLDRVPTIGERSIRWHKSYLAKLCRNPALIGHYQPMTGRVGARKPSGDVVENYYPSIIDEAEFYAAQKALEDRVRKGGRKGIAIANIFSGLCKCGYCGGPMRYVNKGGESRSQYMVCTNAKVGVGCRFVSWRYDDIENTILWNLAGLDIAAILKDDSAQKAKNSLEAERAKLNALRKSIRNLIIIAENADDIDDIQDRISELNSKRKETQENIRTLEGIVKTPEIGQKHFENFRKLREHLNTSTGEELIDLRLRINQELKRFVQQFIFFPDGDEAWTFSMKTLGVRPGKDSRFIAVIFKSGDGRIMLGTRQGLWHGPKTAEGVRNAEIFPAARKTDD